MLTAAQVTPSRTNGPRPHSFAGHELWFHAAPAGDSDAELRVQRLDGRRVLTFWQGTGLGGLSNGTDYVYNAHYRQIAAVKAG